MQDSKFLSQVINWIRKFLNKACLLLIITVEKT